MFSFTIILDLTNDMDFETSTKMSRKSDRIQKWAGGSIENSTNSYFPPIILKIFMKYSERTNNSRIPGLIVYI